MLNCESTISHLIKICDNAIDTHDSIIIVDGYSSDKSFDIAQSLTTTANKKVLREERPTGKGAAIHTILRNAPQQPLLLLDGDLETINPELIFAMLDPIVDDEAGFMIPHYKRDKHDRLITNHVTYPLVKALYNVDIRCPIAGEFALSPEFIQVLLQKSMPYDFGIDIFLTLTAVCEGFRIGEVEAGPKIHHSTKSYATPEESLIPMFEQVVRGLFHMLSACPPVLNSLKKPKQYHLNHETEPPAVPLTSDTFKPYATNKIKTMEEYVLEAIDCCKTRDVDRFKQAWIDWLILYLDKTQDMNNAEAEKFVEQLATLFYDNREMYFQHWIKRDVAQNL